MAIPEEKTEAIKKLHDQLKLDTEVIMGRPCDVVLLTHARHDETGKCDGMSLNMGDADPVEIHRMALHFIMWAEENLQYHMRMMHVPEGTVPN